MAQKSVDLARVLCRKWYADRKVIGTAHHNPGLDTYIYEVLFPDECTEELAAKVIAEAISAQCDANRNLYVLLDTIVDYHKNPSMVVVRDDQLSILDGKKIAKRSTRG
eukprot:CCRYP_003156-RA/>CCRYP_003156-RA protein AED:0.46 eAED:0.46 QI:0/0/0/0.5/1/1/2/0/107